jgi:hypothetical protein
MDIDTQNPKKRLIISRSIVIVIALVLLVWIVYAQTLKHPFINYDDDEYVTQNKIVSQGLTFKGIIWAFTTNHAGNWHPVAWLSHMLDCQLYDLQAGLHHLTSLMLHMANAVLLWLFLKTATGETWKSGMVAMLFAVHPLHVESVAWIAERKNVLCTFFMMLALIFYVFYTREKHIKYYLLSGGSFLVGLMAKPMLVTFPFLLLLIDLWPLDRYRGSNKRASFFSLNRQLILEKIPFVLFSAISSVITYIAQKSGGAVRSWDAVPFFLRIQNAVVAYVIYLKKMLIPGDLSIIYPHPGMFAPWQPWTAFLLLTALSVLFVSLCKRHPYTMVGWCWFLGALIPVIGLIQIGSQAMADRYTYIPLTGLYIILVWGFCDITSRLPLRALLRGLSTGIALGMLTWMAWIQVHYWRDGLTLFQHALKVTQNNSIAHNNLGNIYYRQGHLDQAFRHYLEAVRIQPNFAEAHNNIGAAFVRMGRLETAAKHFRRSLLLNPENPHAIKNLANTLQAMGK